GRQQPLCVFRDADVGWTVRALSEYQPLDFINDADFVNCSDGLEVLSVVFRANRRIMRGEALTFDYFLNQTLSNID
ncbi:hypothetical protein PENTCL1PPCAC_13945, partial [Pristionchus entomophagus]